MCLFTHVLDTHGLLHVCCVRRHNLANFQCNPTFELLYNFCCVRAHAHTSSIRNGRWIEIIKALHCSCLLIFSIRNCELPKREIWMMFFSNTLNASSSWKWIQKIFNCWANSSALASVYLLCCTLTWSPWELQGIFIGIRIRTHKKSTQHFHWKLHAVNKESSSIDQKKSD